MKKLIALLLVLTMAMGLVACGNNGGGETTAATTEASVEVPGSALEILETVWGAYAGEEFFAMGGDFSNPVDNAPGKYNIEDEGMTATLLVPQDQLANVDDAASLVHGMNLNNFTCGVFHVTGDAAAFADAMQGAISTNPWMCGMPEEMIVAVVGGEYVLAAFGLTAVMEPFGTALTESYPRAEVKYDEAIEGGAAGVMPGAGDIEIPLG